MRYIKLLGIKMGDFYSTIEFEQNYSIDDANIYNLRKNELEDSGQVCILLNLSSSVEVL